MHKKKNTKRVETTETFFFNDFFFILFDLFFGLKNCIWSYYQTSLSETRTQTLLIQSPTFYHTSQSSCFQLATIQTNLWLLFSEKKIRRSIVNGLCVSRDAIFHFPASAGKIKAKPRCDSGHVQSQPPAYPWWCLRANMQTLLGHFRTLLPMQWSTIESLRRRFVE